MPNYTVRGVTIQIDPNDKGNPPGKLADAAIIFPPFSDKERAPRGIDAALIADYPHDQAAALAAQRAIRYLDVLGGLKLIGFAIWERRTGPGRNVTFPARQYSVNGERRSFALLRPQVDTTAHDQLRDLILDAYVRHEEAQEATAAAATQPTVF